MPEHSGSLTRLPGMEPAGTDRDCEGVLAGQISNLTASRRHLRTIKSPSQCVVGNLEEIEKQLRWAKRELKAGRKRNWMPYFRVDGSRPTPRAHVPATPIRAVSNGHRREAHHTTAPTRAGPDDDDSESDPEAEAATCARGCGRPRKEKGKRGPRSKYCASPTCKKSDNAQRMVDTREWNKLRKGVFGDIDDWMPAAERMLADEKAAAAPPIKAPSDVGADGYLIPPTRAWKKRREQKVRAHRHEGDLGYDPALLTIMGARGGGSALSAGQAEAPEIRARAIKGKLAAAKYKAKYGEKVRHPRWHDMVWPEEAEKERREDDDVGGDVVDLTPKLAVAEQINGTKYRMGLLGLRLDDAVLLAVAA